MSNKTRDTLTIRIEPATIARVLVMVLVALLFVNFISSIKHPLVLIFISFFLALALNPAVSKISSMLKTRNRTLATGIAYLLVLLVLAAFIAFVVPPLVRQTIDFIKEVPSSIQEYKSGNSPVNSFVERYKLGDQVDNFTTDFGNKFHNLGRPILSTAGAIGAVVGNVITVLVITFMMLVEGHTWLDRFWAVQNPAKKEHRKMLAGKMYKVVTGYVNGQVLIAALGGLFASIALYILSQIFDAPINAVALGGIISLFALLPLIGTTIGSVIVVLACLLVSAPLALAAAIYFIIYQQIENVTIQPYIQARSNNLTPLIVFVTAIIGVSIAGLLGAFAAIPVAGCIKILVEDFYDRKYSPATKQA